MAETISYPYEMESVEPGSTILISSENGRVLLPAVPLVPPDGGVNLTVVPAEETGPYFAPETKIDDTLEPFLLSLAAARSVMLEPDSQKVSRYCQWVNVHAIPRFGGEEQLQFEVIGKNAKNPKAWAMPPKFPKEESSLAEEYPGYTQWEDAARRVGTVDYDSFPVVQEEIEQIKSQIPDRERDILEETKGVTLFDQKADENEAVDDKCIFRFRNFQIMMAKQNPHVKEGGLHLWVHESSGRKAEGVQSDVKNALEQFIISSAIAKSVYAETGRKIGINFMGNWGLPNRLQQEEAVNQGRDPEKNYYREILTAHANLYAAPPDVDRVDLPERPVYSNPEIPEDTRQTIKSALDQHLLSYLQPYENKKMSEIINSI